MEASYSKLDDRNNFLISVRVEVCVEFSPIRGHHGLLLYSFPVFPAFICETDEPRVLNGCVANEALLLHETQAKIDDAIPKEDFNGITQ